MKQRFIDRATSCMARTLHRLGCVVCHPITVQRRRRFAEDIRDEGHALWSGQLAADARRERLRKIFADMDVEPWQQNLADQVLSDIMEGKQLITAMPPQYPQVITYNFGRLVEQAENEARKHLPIRLTASEYGALKANGKLDAKQLYMIVARPVLLDPEVDGYPQDHMAQDEALIAEWESRQ